MDYQFHKKGKFALLTVSDVFARLPAEAFQLSDGTWVMDAMPVPDLGILRGLLGEGAPLSKSSIRRLRAGWTAEFEEWSQRRLEGREVVYVWADGIYVKAGLERDKAALLWCWARCETGRRRCWP